MHHAAISAVRLRKIASDRVCPHLDQDAARMEGPHRAELEQGESSLQLMQRL